MPDPRPLQEISSAPAGARPPSACIRALSASRRSRSALAASRACSRTTCPGRTSVPTATWPVSGSAPTRPRTRKSPWTYSGLFVSTTIPISNPPCTSRRSSAGSASIVSRSFSSAGRPASSPMIGPSHAVIVSSGPIGAAPCDTHGRISTPSKRTPTAPDVSTSSPNSSGVSASGERADARPPSSGSIGAAAESSRSTASVGNVNGSASSSAPAEPLRSGSPLSRPSPSPRGSTSAWNGLASPPSSAAAQTETAVPSSISRISPMTPAAPQPTSSRGASTSCSPSSDASGAARCAPETNATARSHGRPSSASRADAAASAAPQRGSACVESPLPMRTPIARTLPLPASSSRDSPAARSAPGSTPHACDPARRARAAARRALRTHGRGQDRGRPGAGRAAVGRRPIVVGGTGLYLRAALAELDLRPPPDPRERERYARRLADEGVRALHADLLARDPATAAAIARTDAQRVVRALELLDAGAEAPGGPQLWTADTRHPTLLVALVMERGALYRRIDERIEAMVAAGAADEVRRADAGGASPSARQALGFEELLRGDVEAMKLRTRRYAKRQLTWLRKLPGKLELDVTGRDARAVAREVRSALRAASPSRA